MNSSRSQKTATRSRRRPARALRRRRTGSRPAPSRSGSQSVRPSSRRRWRDARRYRGLRRCGFSDRRPFHPQPADLDRIPVPFGGAPGRTPARRAPSARGAQLVERPRGRYTSCARREREAAVFPAGATPTWPPPSFCRTPCRPDQQDNLSAAVPPGRWGALSPSQQGHELVVERSLSPAGRGSGLRNTSAARQPARGPRFRKPLATLKLTSASSRGAADFAQRIVEIAVAQASLSPQLAKGVVEALCQAVEHLNKSFRKGEDRNRQQSK